MIKIVLSRAAACDSPLDRSRPPPELRLHEADKDGNSTVDFIEFMEAFRRRTLQMPLTGAAARGEATFGQQLSSIQTELNRTVMLLITQMAELLESGPPGMPVGSP